MTAAPFRLLGPDHVIGLAATACAAAGLSLLVRRDRGAKAGSLVRYTLAAYLLGATTFLVVDALRNGLTPIELLPFHLCDFAIFVAAFALLTRKQAAYELLYFWALGGTLIAMLTPELTAGFPDLACISFFGIHGGVVASALVLAWGCGMRPRPGAAWRVFLFTNVYAAAVGIVDALTGLNFMYLRAKPTTPTLFDSLGPWPWYLLVADAVALCLFLLLALPFRSSPRPRPS